MADLHLHSRYSRAVSQEMILPQMAQWAKKKGLQILGTGDFTHPLWFRELKAGLEETQEGLYKLKVEKEPLFLLSSEISSIYSQGGKLRRIHNLVLAPSLMVVEKINQELLKRGANLASDGRPIIGISAPDLVELILGVDENCLIIPAHAWTPWFSLYGSESGFDSLAECFGKMAQYIYAVETGLSSSPAMNWRIAELDRRQIVSFSDAHSGPKLAREATVFQYQNSNIKNQNDKANIKNLSYKDILVAIKNDPQGNLKIAYTIEFYPEEGKYHYTGHRNCQVRQSPQETQKLGKICPICGRPLTVGVIHRVEQLSRGRKENLNYQKDNLGVRWIDSPQKNRPSYVMLVPLLEILAESFGSQQTSQKVINEYENLTKTFGSELGVLLKTDVEAIAKISGEKVAEGVKKVREGQIIVEPGYDGVFGTVKIWPENQKIVEEREKEQLSLF